MNGFSIGKLSVLEVQFILDSFPACTNWAVERKGLSVVLGVD